MFNNRHLTLVRAVTSVLALACIAAWPASADAAATITIFSGDPAGVGFNDPTPKAPVGGNAGTTLGQQRLIAFQAAANKWGATLTSPVFLRVLATWEALVCNDTAAVMGSAGATEVFRDFVGATPGRWYGKALASTIFGADLDPATFDIRARFNVNLGQANCLTGVFFYLGLDGNHGNDVDLVTELEHEFAHGLGFQTFTNGSNGAQIDGFPSVWDDFLLDTTSGKTWAEMTNAERVASAVNTGNLVWTGSHVTAAVPSVLHAPQLTVASPPSVAGAYAIGTATFGPRLSSPGITAEVKQVVDQADGTGLACTPLSAINALGVNGKIALIDRGVCTFATKVKNAQNAGAVAVLIVDNAAGSPPAGLTGTDPTITIPSGRITLADGSALKNALKTGSRLRSTVTANLGVNLAIHPGADSGGRALMYAPDPFQGGSSVSHWDFSATPNQLMEPVTAADLTHEVTPPLDLTFSLLKDIGWN